MATNGRQTGFVKEGLEQAQARLEALEKEATKVLNGIKQRSKSSRKEIAALVEKFQAGELFENAKDRAQGAEKELRTRANRLSDEVAERLQAVQQAVLHFVGVASRDEVEDLVSELERISKRLEKLQKVGKVPAKKKAKPNGVDA